MEFPIQADKAKTFSIQKHADAGMPNWRTQQFSARGRSNFLV
jgi:hypothetical protein